MKLSSIYNKNNKLCYFRLDDSEIKTLLKEHIVSFNHSEREMGFWEQIRKYDIIILLTFGKENTIYCTRVLSKFIKLTSGIMPSDKPFILNLELLGRNQLTRIPSPAFFFDKYYVGAEIQTFRELWNQSEEIKIKKKHKYLIHKKSNFQVYIASDMDDYKFVSEIASEHPFGFTSSFLTLIATYKNKKIGALLASPGLYNKRYHNAALRRFRHDLEWIKKKSVCIHRIYNKPQSNYFWYTQKILIEALFNVATNLVSEPISIIEGVSYTCHPLAYYYNFYIELPITPDESYYFWKPFNLPSYLLLTDYSKNQIKKDVKKIRKERITMKYWIVFGSPKNIEYGIKESGWALRNAKANIERWRNLSSGDVVFYMSSHHNKIIGRGTVTKTQKIETGRFKDFPLKIEMKDIEKLKTPIDFSMYLSHIWFTEQEGGGIKLIPENIGMEITGYIENNATFKKSMIVYPNPYLLHETKFPLIKNRIFVVLSWSLLDTVYPYIKEILENADFSVTYAGSREGQLVFSDVWRMLNEAESVLVDFTNRRPNVYLEYGMALVVGKPIIAITQNKEDIPSDTPHLRYIFYSDNMNGYNELRTKLPLAVKTIIEDVNRLKES